MFETMVIENVLSKRRLRKILKLLRNKRTQYFDGKNTAMGFAKIAKQNFQLDPNQNVDGINVKQFLNQIGEWAIDKNRNFSEEFSLGLPVHREHHMIQLYDGDLEARYDWHVDNPNPNRGSNNANTHAISIILNDDFEGGVLEVKEPGGRTNKIKPKAGSMVIFPVTHVHRVTPVTKGERFAYVQWINYNYYQDVDSWRLYKSIRKLWNIITERVRVNEFDDATTQPTPQDIVDSFQKSLDKYNIDEYEWIISLLNEIRTIKIQAMKKVEMGR